MLIISKHTQNIPISTNSPSRSLRITPQNDVISFKEKQKTTPNKYYVATTKFLNKLQRRSLGECNFNRLEGIQNGLKSFEGLSLKQIAFALTDLHSINMVSGCTRHCIHCYANSQPDIKRYSYEDLKQICDDIKELQNRTGSKVVYNHGEPYIDCGFDTDALECHLYDKNRNKHDFIEIAKLLKESTGYTPVFDTNGWSRHDKEKQKIANEYVKRLLEDNNYKNFYQINISINPFNPAYVRAIKSGYPLNKLYSPINRVGDEYLEEEAKLSPEFKKIRDDYTNYVKDVANVLLTFKPLLKIEKFGTIIRVLDNKITQMAGFRQEEFQKTLAHIYTELRLRHDFTNEISKEELKQFDFLLNHYDDRIFTAGRMEKFYKVQNNGSLDGIETINDERAESKTRLEKIKSKKSVKSGHLRYLKMINPDGKVYMYDNYAVIPTDIKLKTSVENINKPFQIKVEDFTVTENMMDLF